MKMDYKRMLEEIDLLVNNDFCADMSMYECLDEEYPREASVKMADIIGKVYSISHAVHCSACGQKFLIKTK